MHMQISDSGKSFEPIRITFSRYIQDQLPWANSLAQPSVPNVHDLLLGSL